MKNTYGLVLKEKREPVRPVKMDLSGKAGSRVVMAAAKRVMAACQGHQSSCIALAIPSTLLKRFFSAVS